jgi:Asp-tRNA(Asn)/Glu-tRNA(Gln) amidotransferase A subunit family amidase
MWITPLVAPPADRRLRWRILCCPSYWARKPLDTLGGFARSVRDVALLASVLAGDARIAHQPCFAAVNGSKVNLNGIFGWLFDAGHFQTRWRAAPQILNAVG